MRSIDLHTYSAWKEVIKAELGRDLCGTRTRLMQRGNAFAGCERVECERAEQYALHVGEQS
jgi:hypothetical protein